MSRNVFVMTMVHNEKANLQRWAGYYSRLFGAKNLFVLDHGSTDGSVDCLPPDANKMYLPRTNFDDVVRADFVSSLHQNLLKYYDIGIYIDCDEFLVADPIIYKDLKDYCERLDKGAPSAVGLNVIQNRREERALNPSMPILSQRKFSWFEGSMSKPLVSAGPIRWNPGFHTSDQPPSLDTSLFLFHTKYADFEYCAGRLEFTRKMAWSQNALDKNQGKHQRVSNDEMEKKFFLTEKLIFRRELMQFDFEVERERIQTESSQNKAGMWVRPALTAKLVSIPERFKGIF